MRQSACHRPSANFDHWYEANQSITVDDFEYPTHSKLLGPNGQPLAYEPRQKMGFDLSKRH